jgi:hypothetical protein
MNLSKTVKKRILIGAIAGALFGVLLLIRHTVILDFGLFSLGVYVLEFPATLVHYIGIPSSVYSYAVALIASWTVFGAIIGYFAKSLKTAIVSIVIVVGLVSFGAWMFLVWIGKSITNI